MEVAGTAWCGEPNTHTHTRKHWHTSRLKCDRLNGIHVILHSLTADKSVLRQQQQPTRFGICCVCLHERIVFDNSLNKHHASGRCKRAVGADGRRAAAVRRPLNGLTNENTVTFAVCGKVSRPLDSVCTIQLFAWPLRTHVSHSYAYSANQVHSSIIQLSALSRELRRLASFAHQLGARSAARVSVAICA